MKINKFAHLTFEEFSKGYLLARKPRKSNYGDKEKIRQISKMPETPNKYVNWVGKRKVTPVLAQGDCGCCYSFATNGALESFYAIHVDNKTLPTFSKQYLVDCGPQLNNELKGCNGGDSKPAFEFFKAKGAVLEMNYPIKEERATVNLH